MKRDTLINHLNEKLQKLVDTMKKLERDIVDSEDVPNALSYANTFIFMQQQYDRTMEVYTVVCRAFNQVEVSNAKPRR